MTSDTKDAVARRTGARSPNYPYIALPEALDRITKLYKEEHRQAAPWGVAATHWSYSPTSSSMDKVVGALNAYGLIDTEGSGDDRKLKLSSRALDIVEDQREESAERDRAIQDAALSPPVHRSLRDKFGHRLPSDGTISTYLVRELGFNPKSVDAVIANYRSTIERAGLDKAGDPAENGSVKSSGGPTIQPGTFVQWVSQGSAQFLIPRRVVRIDERDGEKFVCVLDEDGKEGWVPMNQVTIAEPPVDRSGVGAPPLTPPTIRNRPQPPGTIEEVFTVGDRRIVVQFPTVLSADEFQDVADWLPILERKLKRCVKTTTSDETKSAE